MELFLDADARCTSDTSWSCPRAMFKLPRKLLLALHTEFVSPVPGLPGHITWLQWWECELVHPLWKSLWRSLIFLNGNNNCNTQIEHLQSENLKFEMLQNPKLFESPA